ncbi:hypothetical protein SCUCBS95973_003188 [Sporothrix curviconia]|uniref:Uncharacterized protein n=1 Tax=Sporothrix curviconia TaxID=1260050 RepID=A0ABP0BEA6_9PEZI
MADEPRPKRYRIGIARLYTEPTPSEDHFGLVVVCGTAVCLWPMASVTYGRPVMISDVARGYVLDVKSTTSASWLDLA